MFIYSALVSDGAYFHCRAGEVTEIMDKDVAQCAAEGVFKLSLAGFYGQPQVNAARCILPTLLRGR